MYINASFDFAAGRRTTDISQFQNACVTALINCTRRRSATVRRDACDCYWNDSGVIGEISNEELAAGGYTADWTKSAPSNSKQYYMIGSIEHELSEVMGRVSYDGTSGGATDSNGNPIPGYTIMDLFRFSNGGWLGPLRATAPNTGSDYFSIDNGAQAYYYWNNTYSGSNPVGDLGDWAPSGPNNTDPTGNDAFLNNSNPGVINEVSAYDLDLMNVVGWDRSPHFGLSINGPPPAGTTSAMILRRLDGSYQLADIGNDSILSSYSFNQPGANWGSDWYAVALGSFADGDTTDLLLRNNNASDPNAGAFEVYNIINNNITSGALAGTVSLDWWILGFGNFSSRGETDMLMRNSKTNDVAIYDIKNDQITGSFDLGNIGSDWQVQSGLFGLGKIAPIGNFSSLGESDLILRNVNTGELKVWDISNNQVTNTASLGTISLDWQIVGSGDFSSRPGETDLMLRNANTGALEVVDIRNNQMSGPYSIGSAGSTQKVVGFGPMDSLGVSSMMLWDCGISGRSRSTISATINSRTPPTWEECSEDGILGTYRRGRRGDADSDGLDRQPGCECCQTDRNHELRLQRGADRLHLGRRHRHGRRAQQPAKSRPDALHRDVHRVGQHQEQQRSSERDGQLLAGGLGQFRDGRQHRQLHR